MSFTITFNNTEELVNNFAKATKVSRAKLNDFVETLKANAIKVKPVRVSNGKPFRKPVGAEAMRVRQWLENEGHTLVGKQMTTKDLAKMLGIDHVTAGNGVQWFAKNKGTIKFVGNAPKEANTRGRPALLWEMTSKQENSLVHVEPTC